MPRKKKPVVEIVRVVPLLPPVASPPSPQELLERLIAQKVAEALAERDDFLFEPHFRERRVSYELRRLMTVPERKKWTVYFDRWGCLKCGTKRAVHAANGYCPTCRSKVVYRLKQILKELRGERPYAAQDVGQIVSSVTSAEQLLGPRRSHR